MIVLDNGRLLCRATRAHVAMGAQWLLKAYAFSWTDPRAQKPNVFGIVQPNYMLVKSKREARMILRRFQRS